MEQKLSEDEVGDNCIQNFHFEIYIVEKSQKFSYTAARGGPLKLTSGRLSDNMHAPSQMKCLNMVIPIQMYFDSFVSNWSVESCLQPHAIQIMCLTNDVNFFPTVYCRRFFCIFF